MLSKEPGNRKPCLGLGNKSNDLFLGEPFLYVQSATICSWVNRFFMSNLPQSGIGL